jgi:hypothetical protein
LLSPSTPDFFNTLYDPYAPGTDFVRGYPFSMREGKPTAVSHGLWLNIPDYDAPTQMVKPSERNTRYVDAVMTIPKVGGWVGGWVGAEGMWAALPVVPCLCPELIARWLPAVALLARLPPPTPPLCSLLPLLLLLCAWRCFGLVQGTLFPMCGMNLAFDRTAIGPAMYFGLMGEGQPWGR